MTIKLKAAALILSALMLAGCGNDNTNVSAVPESPEVSDAQVSQAAPDNTPESQMPQAAQETGQATQESGQADAAEPFAQAEPDEPGIEPEPPSIDFEGLPLAKGDLVVSAPGGQIEFDQHIDDVLAVLGNDYEYYEAISCAYDGMDKTFAYDGLDIYTYPDGQDDYVVEMIITSDSYKTTRDITVGSTRDEVIAAYGEDFSETAVMIEYEADGSCISFTLADDVVESIDFFR